MTRCYPETGVVPTSFTNELGVELPSATPANHTHNTNQIGISGMLVHTSSPTSYHDKRGCLLHKFPLTLPRNLINLQLIIVKILHSLPLIHKIQVERAVKCLQPPHARSKINNMHAIRSVSNSVTHNAHLKTPTSSAGT